MLSLTHAPRSCTNPRMHPALEEYYPSTNIHIKINMINIVFAILAPP